MANSNLPRVRANLPDLDDEELDGMSTADRRAEAFLLHCTGWTQKRIANELGVSQGTIAKDLEAEKALRRHRSENVDHEIERIAGIYEGVMVKAWSRHEEAANSKIQSLAGSNYLRIVLDSAEKLAHLRGLDVVKTSTKTSGVSRVIVQIGGSGDQPQIAVGVESE